MARRKAKAPVEGGTENFQTPKNAGRNGAQWPKGFGGDYWSGSEDINRTGAVRSDKQVEGRPLSDEEVGALIQQELTDARTYIDLEVGPLRAAATMAYRGIIDYAAPEGDSSITGQSYLDESLSPATQSEIASRDVRDTILGLLPDLMRIFTSTESVCEYKPETQLDVDMAEQATDYANYVFMRDNPGFMNLHSAFKDAMKFKTAIMKVWWDDSERVRTEHYRNIDPNGLFMLDNDSEVEGIEVLKTIHVNADTGEVTTNKDQDGIPLVDVRVTRRITQGRIRVEALPSEEFLIDRRARSLYCEGPSMRGFTVCAHRSMRTVGEMVALGFDEDVVRQHVTSPELDTNIEYIARQPWARVVGSFDGMNPSTQRLLVAEAYAWIDGDGDGIPELWQIWCAGPSYKIIHREPVECLPFVDFQCDPEPHTFFGESIADVTMDIQRIKTQIWRDSLDSLSQSVRPRMAIVEGQVNYDDVLNNEIGAVIRMRAPGMVTPLETPFVGQSAFPMIEYVDEVLQKRTGVSLQSMGLDPDALQSTTRSAVMQQISNSQGRVELLARILAEGMRKVFKLILNLSVTHQDRPRVVQLRGKWVPIDPRYWNADMGVEIAVGLGNGTAEQKIMVLMQIKAAQEQILQLLGPGNPLCSLGQYSNTLRKLAELSGFRDASQFFNNLPANYQPPQGTGQPPPNPQLMDAQTNQQKAQAQIQLDTQRFQLEQWKAQQENQRLQQKDQADQAFRIRQMELDAEQNARTNYGNLALQREGQQMQQRTQFATSMLQHGATVAGQRAQNTENNASKERIAAIMARAQAASKARQQSASKSK
jgi:hypothetical protein